jgi:3-phenylpropionate/trans-cinnamate dioxygenase ferredoxin subunit
MSDLDEERAATRLDRVVSSLLAGRRLPGRMDPGDAGAVRAAGLLAGAVGDPRMPPGLRRRLARMLEPRPAMTRRAALAAGLGIAVGVAAGAGGELLANRRAAPSPRRPVVSRAILEPDPRTAAWIDTGLAVSQLAEGVPYRVRAGAVEAFVVRRGGRLMAMSAYCTHLPCALVWRSHQGLVCPCHGQRFDLEGDPIGGWPLPPLPLVGVRARGGRVEVLGTT